MLSLRRVAQLLGHNSPIYALSAYRLANQFLSAGGDGWVVLWDLTNLPDGKLLAKVDGNIFALAYLPDRHIAVVGTMYGGVHWLDLDSNQQIAQPQAHKGGTYALYHWGDKLFSAGADGRLVCWNTTTQQKEESLHLSHQNLRSITAIGDSKYLAVAGSDGAIYIVDYQEFKLVHTLEKAHDGSIFSLLYNKSSHNLWSGARDAFLRQWSLPADIDNISLQYEQPAHLFTLNDLAASPCGQYIASASRDKTIKIWRSKNAELLKVIDTIRHGAHTHSINALLWTNYEKNWLISASDDRSLMVWELVSE
jgi:WD40 repeat protein